MQMQVAKIRDSVSVILVNARSTQHREFSTPVRKKVAEVIQSQHAFHPHTNEAMVC